MNDVQSQALPPSDNAWTVWRIDDNGIRFVVRERLTRQDADGLVAEFEARGHKQTYWAEPEAQRLPHNMPILHESLGTASPPRPAPGRRSDSSKAGQG